MKWSHYLIVFGLYLRTFFQIIFRTKQSFVMTNIHLGLITIFKQLIQEKNNAYRSYILSDKNPKIFENQLKCLIEGNKGK